MNIKRPKNIPPYAEASLQALSAAGLGHHISLGGAFALLHYHDYRTTHDIDAHKRKTFSFQIASRSAQLQPGTTSPWAHIPLDSFTDLVASKMAALVERGAPRDFIDIYTVCQAGLITPQACWELWQQRQQLRHFDNDLTQAKFATRVRLMQIEQRRPLKNIQELQTRSAAEQLRNWYKREFLDDTNDA